MSQQIDLLFFLFGLRPEEYQSVNVYFSYRNRVYIAFWFYMISVIWISCCISRDYSVRVFQISIISKLMK